jgi:hypothetical protein
LWEPGGSTGIQRYTRTETVNCSAHIGDTDSSSVVGWSKREVRFTSVSFTNGNATRSWNDGTIWN